MQMIRTVVTLVLLTLVLPAAWAQGASSKGMATVTFTGKFSPATKQDALQKAKANALDRYFSETNQAKAKNFELIRPQLIGSIDTYVLGATVLSEELDEKGGSYTVVVRADINAPKLENALQGSSAMANTTTADKSLLSFVFVARQQKAIQSFDDKVYKRTDTQGNANQSAAAHRQTSESEHVGKSKVETADEVHASLDVTQNASVAITTGGSTTKKADVVEWDVTRAGEINSVITGTFSNAGYEVVEAEYLEQESNGLLSIDAIRKDYSRGDDLAPATMRNVVNGVKTAGVPFVALGTLDVGLKDNDPATGLVRVFVTVSGKVLNVAGRFPKTVSSVGPVQFAGLGPNETVARTNALKQAAENAAQQLMNELNAKGVQ